MRLPVQLPHLQHTHELVTNSSCKTIAEKHHGGLQGGSCAWEVIVSQDAFCRVYL